MERVDVFLLCNA